MSPLSWPRLLKKAWQSSTSTFTFYLWTLPAAFVGLLATRHIEVLEKPSPDWSFLLLPLLTLFIFYLCQAFLKAGLLEEIHQKEKRVETSLPPLLWSFKRFFLLLRRSGEIELGILGLILSFSLVIALPFLVSFLYNPSALKTLAPLGFFVALPIIVFLLIFRELLYLYRTVSSLRLGPASEAALLLCSQRTLRILQLFLLILFTFCIFTILLNAVMLTSASFWEQYFSRSARSFLQYFLLVFLQAWFLIFWQALWYYGFEFIAKVSEPEEKETLPETEEVPAPTL